jgi:hypothetical protein
LIVSNLETAREYIKAIENGATGEALARYFTPDVRVHEMPNRIAPHGSVADLDRALAGAQRGKQLFKRQTYTITNALSDGDWVALEIDWLGITAVQVQNLPPDSEIRDHVAVFLFFRGGRIARQNQSTNHQRQFPRVPSTIVSGKSPYRKQSGVAG